MKDNLICFGGNALTYVLTALQTNEVFQIIELVLSITLTLILITFKLWKWYKEAKADGKITADEIQKGIDILEEGKDKLDKHDQD